MNSKHLPIVLSLLGLAAAWYWSRKQAAELAAIAAGIAQQPTLPSRQIGNGYISPIAPIIVDRATGEASAPYGTDLLLDPDDPAFGFMADSLPDVQPLVDFSEYH